LKNSILERVVKEESEERDKSFEALMKQFGVLFVFLSATLFFLLK
jgi:hypothetical protein